MQERDLAIHARNGRRDKIDLIGARIQSAGRHFEGQLKHLVATAPNRLSNGLAVDHDLQRMVLRHARGLRQAPQVDGQSCGAAAGVRRVCSETLRCPGSAVGGQILA